MHSLVVIDDEYLVVEGIKAMIARQKLNYEVIGCAYDGISGLEVVRKKQPDLVITDIRIPGLDGLSLIEAARKCCLQTLFVVISGYSEFEYAQRALTLGVKSYIDKPISIQNLKEVLNRVESEFLQKKPGFNQQEGLLKKYSQFEYSLEKSIEALTQSDAVRFHEYTEQGFRYILELYPEPADYKREIYKFLCVLCDILYEQKEQKRSDFFVSYQKIEALQTKQKLLEYGRGVVSQIAQLIESDKTGSSHRIILQLLDYINENYNYDIRLNELADMVSMNTAYLSVLFKEEVGRSFVKYLTDLRMIQAEKFLLAGKKVNEVSRLVGYNNYRYFCDVFKKHMGMTPYEYKNGMKKKN